MLELLSDAAATSSSLEVSWRPPSKNSERITGYKLMVATSTGGARGASCAGGAAAVACVRYHERTVAFGIDI